MPSSDRERPLIAIVGSAAENRTYAPPLRGIEGVREACRQLGGALARAGCDLAVFSSKPDYVEQHVVAGYAEAFDAGSGAKVIAFPPRHKELQFDLPAGSALPITVN